MFTVEEDERHEDSEPAFMESELMSDEELDETFGGAFLPMHASPMAF